MREREADRAEPLEHPEHPEAGADRVSGLDGDEAGDPALGVGLHEGDGVVDEGQVGGVLHDEPLDEVDLLERDLHGVAVLGAAGSVRHPQLERGEKKAYQSID